MRAVILLTVLLATALAMPEAPSNAPTLAPTRAPTAAPTLAPTHTQCAIGQYSLGTSCANCAAGYFAPAASRNSSCAACEAGTYAGATGASVCTTCAAGSSSASAAATVCATCEAGTYQSGTMLNCSACPDGSYAAAGASSCTQAAPGSYANGLKSANVNCSAGTYSPGNVTACTNCAVGKFSADAASVCSPCPAGTFQANTGATTCMPCATGKYNKGLGAEVCTSCPINTFTAVTGWQSDCVPCPANKTTFSTTGSSSCSDCPGGQVSAPGMACHAPGSRIPDVPPVNWLATAGAPARVAATVAGSGALTINIPHRVHSQSSYTFGNAVVTLTSQRVDAVNITYRPIRPEDINGFHADPEFQCYTPGYHVVAAFAVDSPTGTLFAVSADLSQLPYTTRGREIWLCNGALEPVNTHCNYDAAASTDNGTVVTGYACSKGIFAVVESRHYTLDCDAGTFGFICEHNVSYRTGSEWYEYLMWTAVITLAACEFAFFLRVALGTSDVTGHSILVETESGESATKSTVRSVPFAETVLVFTKKVSPFFYGAGAVLLAVWAVGYRTRDLDPSTSRGTENGAMRVFTHWAQTDEIEFRCVYAVAFFVAAIVAWAWYGRKWIRRELNIKPVDGSCVTSIRLAEWARAAVYALLAVLLLPLLNSSDVAMGWLLVIVPFAAVLAAAALSMIIRPILAALGMKAWKTRQIYACLVSIAYSAFFLGIGFVLMRRGGKSFKWADRDLHGAW